MTQAEMIAAAMNLEQSPECRRLLKYYMSEGMPLVERQQILSDEDVKDIKAIMSRGGPFKMDEVALLMTAAGDNTEDDSDDETMMDKYAQNLHNYLYNYKEGTQNIDPSIDPAEEQIGIMAQDLEKVNPACIKETPEGVKTVDTGRLALMNAGVIADLVRRIEKLEAQ